MKKLSVFLLIALSIIIQGCKKENNRKYSTWIVNGTGKFTQKATASIDCNPDHSYCRASLTTEGSNRFGLGFRLDHFPTTGKYELITYTPQEEVCAITFYYHDKFYYHTPSKAHTMYASSERGKASYTMPPSRFVNYNNPTGDSILIEGTFNEP